MTLIHRSSLYSEYAQLLSTRPHTHTPLAAWHPSLEDLHTLSRHVRTDPDLSQSRIFAFSAPLFTFAALLALGVLLPRHPHALGTLGTTNTAVLAFALLAGLLAGLALLRALIWGVALAIGEFAEQDMRSTAGRRHSPYTFELSQSNIIIGGMFA